MSPTLIDAIVLLLTVLYALLTEAAARRYFVGRSRIDGSWTPLLIGVVSLHFLALLLRGLETRSCPVLTQWEALSFFAFSVAAIYLVLELRRKIRVTAFFVLSIAMFTQFLSAVFIIGDSAQQGSGSPDFGASLHAFAALFGLSGVVVAGTFGALYIHLHRKIQSGSHGLFYNRMPSLEELSDLNASAAAVAFLALSVTVGIGGYSYFSVDPSELTVALPIGPIALTVGLWLLLGVCAVGHRLDRFGGVRLAGCTVIALLAAFGLLFSIGQQGVHG